MITRRIELHSVLLHYLCGNMGTVLKYFQVSVPRKECATMLTQVWQCGQPLSTAHKVRNLGRHCLDVYWFHWHKLLHSQLSTQYNQSGIREINSTERAWSNRCIFQTSAICSSTGTLQEGGQAVVLVGSVPAGVVKLIRMKNGKEANRLSILTHWLSSAYSHWTKQITCMR